MRWLGALILIVGARAQDDRPDAILTGVEYLLKSQKSDGSWGSDATFGKDKSIRSAITAISIRALKETKQGSKADIDEAVRKGMEFLSKNAGMAPGKPSYGMYNFSTYACDFAALLDDEELSKRCVELISKNQRADGGFTYMHEKGSMKIDTYESFPTALTLLTLWELKQKGREIPQATFDRALEALKATRTEDGYFCYHVVDGKQRGSISGNGKLSWEGSLARTVCCEYVLWRVGQGDTARLKTAVTKFFDHREALEAVRTKDRKTHQGEFDNAPYYYLFGHWFALLAIQQLDRATQEKYLPELRRVLMSIREPKGTWFDSRICGRHYGCALALLMLTDLHAVKAWY